MTLPTASCGGLSLTAVMVDAFLGTASAEIHGDDDEEPSIFVSTDPPPPESDNDSDSNDVIEEEEEPSIPTVPDSLIDTFAGQVLAEWFRRSPFLEHEYALTAWVCSPAEPIMRHAKENLTGPQRRKIESLLKKLLVQDKPTEAEQRRETSRVINGFWQELNEFWGQQGEFSPDQHCWYDERRETEPHIWHRTHSYPFTKIFGKIACITTSKPVGIGEAERDWSFNKDIKSSKRSKVSSKVLMQQVVCHAAYSVERKAARQKEEEALKLTWTDDEFESLGLDKFLIDIAEVTGEKKTKRIFYAFIEDWEETALVEKSVSNEILLRRKYGHVKYYDIDDGGFVPRIIDPNQVRYSSRKKEPGVFVYGTPAGGSMQESWLINSDLHFMIRTYYKRNPDDPEIELVTWEQYKGLDTLPEDEAYIDEWIENGGKFPPKKPAARSKKSSARKPGRCSSKAAGKKPAPKLKPPPAAKKPESAPSDGESSSDEELQQPMKKQRREIDISSGSSSDDDGDSESDETKLD